MKVLRIVKDPTEGVEGYDEKIAKVVDYIQNMHLSCSEDGTSHVAVVDRGEGSIRIVSGADLEKLAQFIQATEESDGPFISVNYLTVHTKQ